MSYEISVRCDIRAGNPLEKKRCHSDAQAKKPPVVAYGSNNRDTIHALLFKAKVAGWVHVRRPGVVERWVCPVCAETASFAGFKNAAKRAKKVASLI